MIKVLFICLGNICRSPTAEGLFRKAVEDHDLTAVLSVDSAGTSDWHIGGPPDGRSQEIAHQRGIDLSGLRARQVTSEDFRSFDYIIAMDSANHAKLLALAPTGFEDRLHMCLSFAPTVTPSDVPDPYYDGNFDHVFDMISEACEGLLTDIRKTHSL